jgi:hypothetical protein
MSSDTMELHRQRITGRARAARPGPVFLTVLTWLVMAVPMLLGWLAGAGWFLVAWMVSAAVEGGKAGWQNRPGAGAPPG